MQTMILCLDYGTRYVGLAITDYDEKFAVRHSVIDQKQQPVLPLLANIIEQEKISTLLVGLPISLSGNESEQTQITRDFIKILKENFEGIPIKEVDETLTSSEAEQQVAFEGGKKETAHAEAARIMLTEYLSKQTNSGHQ